ncbi:MAG: hypothetical protein ACFCVD_23085 [Nodosilinea sp.]
MKLLTNSILFSAAGLLAAAGVSLSPASACIYSQPTAPEVTTSLNGPTGLSMTSLDSSALGKALGGFGLIAAVLVGGTVVYRQRRLARLVEANEAALMAETDLAFTTHEEMVMVDEPGSPGATTSAEEVLQR